MTVVKYLNKPFTEEVIFKSFVPELGSIAFTVDVIQTIEGILRKIVEISAIFDEKIRK